MSHLRRTCKRKVIIMARTTIKIKYTDPKQANQTIERILSSHNYKHICENGENVWKCGVGFWTAMKYIKIEFADNNTVLVSGWIRAVAGSEQDLNGFAGGLPKKQIMNVIQELQQYIH